MAGGSVGNAGPCSVEVKASKTNEFHNWLDKEIKRVYVDLQILGTTNVRYLGLTSDEKKVKFLKDQDKIKDLNKYFEFLHFTKEANIDVDAIAKVCDEFDFFLPENGGYPLLNGKFGRELKINIEWQIGFLLRVGQYDNNSTFSFTSLHWSGNIKIHKITADAIQWVLSDGLIFEVTATGHIYVGVGNK